MTYHPIIGILIFLITIILSFYLGKNTFKKYRNKEKKINLTVLETQKKTRYVSPPKGDVTSPDAPWLKE